MAKDASYLDFILHDVLNGLPGIATRAMFGGWALYLDGVVFGIVIESEFYVKVNDADRGVLERMGSRPFVYRRQRRAVSLPYWLVPGRLLDEPEDLADLIRRAASRPGP
ncbi:MAG TPA: TfoX/Sxy family protein [Aestuariivirgaceae bacterium]|nr:TfoX/Sxy family protein [Aestuariivirgaceae bacterium]